MKSKLRIPQKRLSDRLREQQKNLKHVCCYSTSLEETYVVALQKPSKSFKSSKMLPDWFFRVVLWLTWPGQKPNHFDPWLVRSPNEVSQRLRRNREGRWWSIWRASFQNETWHLVSQKRKRKKKTMIASMHETNSNSYWFILNSSAHDTAASSYVQCDWAAWFHLNDLM